MPYIPNTQIINSVGTWQDFVPTLTAASVNPTLGSGSSIVGRYIQIGKFVQAFVQITFGTSGVTAGTGTYYISVPVNFGASAFSYSRTGIVLIYDSSAVLTREGIATRDASNHRMVLEIGSGTTTAVTVADNTPWVWAANDQIHATFSYECA